MAEPTVMRAKEGLLPEPPVAPHVALRQDGPRLWRVLQHGQETHLVIRPPVTHGGKFLEIGFADPTKAGLCHMGIYFNPEHARRGAAEILEQREGTDHAAQ